MKKIYFSLLLVSVGFYGNTQTKSVKKSANLTDVASKNPLSYQKISLWEDDFSVLTNWEMTNTSVPAVDWSIITNPDASPRAEFRPFAFTSMANGYAFINSDAEGEAGIQSSVLTYTGVIDLSTNTNVSLTFEQAHRRYRETTSVLVSADNGATWTTFVVNESMVTNTNSANPELVQVDISSAAANMSQVKIAFQYDGAFDWFWAIDDVKIIETYQNDISLNSVYWGTTGAFGVRMPYSKVPLSQNQAIDFSGVVKNIGVLDDADAQFNVSGGAYTGSSAATLIPSNTTDTLDAITQATLPAVLGITTFDFNTSSSATDGNSANNSIASRNIEITSSQYARDMGVQTGTAYNQGQGFQIANKFDIFTDIQTNSISFMPASSSVVGATVFVRLLDVDLNFITESNPYVLTDSDLGTMITLNLLETIDLVAGATYVASVGSLGNGGLDNDLVVATSGVSEAQTSNYFDETDQTWYYTTSTPMVRLNLGNAPTITSSDVDNILCLGGTLTLTSSQTSGNSWMSGGVEVGTSNTLSVDAAGTYTVTAGGVSSSSISVTIQDINSTTISNGGVASVIPTNGATYQWSSCSPVSPINGATSSSFTAQQNGDYSVTVTINGCSETSSPCVTISGVDLNENAAFASFSVFPNPASENVAIDFSLKAESTVHVAITDLSGKMIYTSNLGNKSTGFNSLNVNTSAFANGIYVVNVLTENGIATEKLVIRK